MKKLTTIPQLRCRWCLCKRSGRIIAVLYTCIAFIVIGIFSSKHFSKESNIRAVSAPMNNTSLYTVRTVDEHPLNETNPSRIIKSHQTDNSISLHPKITYTLENPALCKSAPDLRVLVIVHSATTNVDRRDAIRATWTNNSYFPDLGRISVLFLLGKAANLSLHRSIVEEFHQYGDILQGNFVDSYRNLTYKAIMGYQWLTERCRSVETIVKVDDDIVMNTFLFMKNFLPRFTKTPRHIACRRLLGSVIDRNKNSKWYVEPDVFKGQTRYPDFCQGFFVVVSNDLIPELYAASLATEYFWIDDVFLYGLVAKKVKAIKYDSLKYGSDVIWGANKPEECYKTMNRNCPYLAIMPWSDTPRTIRTLWRMIVNKYNINLSLR